MLQYLVSLIIVSQLITPMSGVVLGMSVSHDRSPQRVITGSFEPILESEAAFAMDAKTGAVLYQKGGYEARPIASITKLMTALVFLEREMDDNETATISRDDKKNGGRVEVLPGEILRLKDVLQIALVGSVNSAAYELAESTDLSYEEFIVRMNEKAREIGMKQANFVDPAGLSENNRASAEDVAILLRMALQNDIIKEALNTEVYSFRAVGGAWHRVKNTNLLLESYLDIEGGKTGYIDEAGYCLVNLVKCDDCEENIIVVILDAPSKEVRFQENKFLSQWVFDNWKWE